MPQITLRDVTIHLTHPPLLENANLVVQPGEKIALVGRNGTGKSTMLKVLAGKIKIDAGELEISSSTKISYLEQEVLQDITGSIYHVVASGLGNKAELLERYHNLSEIYAKNLDDKSLDDLMNVQQQMDAQDGWSVQQQVETVLSRLGLPSDEDFAALSGGMKRRVLLGRALVNEPDVILLDEPTNHLDIETITWLEKLLKSLTITVIFISHDRAFTRAIAQRIIELDRGVLSDWPGTFDNYLLRKEEALHAESLERERFAKKLSQEETWIRQGIKARRTRNEGRVRALKAMRVDAAAQQKQMGKVSATIQEADKSGKQVVMVENISFAYPNKTVVKNFTTSIMRSDKIGLVGANGVGKTTLIKLLLGELKPDTGVVTLGTKLEISYFDQLREQLDNNQTVRENVGGGSDQVTINGKQKHIMSYLQEFLFSPDRANGMIKNLSGGERNRLLLAKLFTRPANLLVLDEPTNDLDLETLELLEELLSDYTGTVLVISHDREFLDNLVTKALVFTGDGCVVESIADSSVWVEMLNQGTKNSNYVPAKLAGNNNANKENTKNTEINTSNAASNNTKRAPLSYRDQKELQQLPKKIEELEQKLAALQLSLADPALYQANQEEAKSLAAQLKDVEHALAVAYSRWDELEQKG